MEAPFVTCKRFAGAGNQLFMIAATIGTALKNNVRYLIPTFTSNNSIWPPVLNGILPHYDGKKHIITRIHKEDEGFKFKEIEYKEGENLCLEGYFQSEKYFKDYQKEIREAFDFYKEWNKGFVAIHHRRGDYLKYPTKHPIPHFNNYYLAAMKVFPNYKFMVFSDDIKWVREAYRPIDRGQFLYINQGDPIVDLRLMAGCEHLIIANSTYSWFGGFLCANPDKIVVCPSAKNWFGEGNSRLTTEHIIPDSWIQIEY